MINSRRKILMLEDSELDATHIEHALEKYYDVTVVGSVENARRKMSSEYECFLFDYDINGQRVGDQLLIESMKRGTIKIPCILMSQYDPGRDVRKEHGFAGFIDKTSSGWIDRLLTTVQAALDNSSDDVLEKILTSAGCIDDPLNDYDFGNDIFFTGLEVQSAFLRATTVGDLLRLSKDPEISPGPRAHLRDLLRAVYRQKQDRRLGRS
ncbi:MAG: response regulator transcription factor [Thaumarchaeota archaeon]|nr:response regulator transcription factor [Nitrososphaerota archaeon]